jgi:hypothetical protein
MRDFFASLRRMLAINLGGMNLGAIAQEFIKKVAIPRVQKRLEGETKEKEKKELEDLLALYFKYADPKSQEGKLYDKTAVNLVFQIGRSWKMPQEDQEDLMQDIAVDFYQPRSKLGVDLREALGRFDETDGPVALNKLWASIIDRRLQSTLRDKKLQYKERTVDLRKDEDDNELDPFSNLHAPGQVDERHVQELIKGLPVYVNQRVTKPEMKEMFKLWFDNARDHDVNMKKEVYPKVMKKYGTPEMTLAGWWRMTQKVVMQYFIDELGPEIAPRIKNIMHLGAVETVTHIAYRRKLSKWMLGGLLYAKVYGVK